MIANLGFPTIFSNPAPWLATYGKQYVVASVSPHLCKHHSFELASMDACALMSRALGRAQQGNKCSHTYATDGIYNRSISDVQRP